MTHKIASKNNGDTVYNKYMQLLNYLLFTQWHIQTLCVFVIQGILQWLIDGLIGRLINTNDCENH